MKYKRASRGGILIDLLNLHTTTLARFFVKSVLHFLFTIWTHIRIFACLSTFFRVPFRFAKRGTKRAAAGSIGGVVQGDRHRDLSPLYGGKRENGCRLCFGAVLGRLGRGTYRGLGKVNTPTGVKVVPGFARSPPLTPEPAAVRWPRRTGQPDGTKPKGKHDRPAP